jgi:probable F420-dependent oxidoreductase
MKFSYAITMPPAAEYVPLARAAEAAGFDYITIPDSLCYPQEASSKYPYNADGTREFLESLPFVESLIAVTAMATATEKLRFLTSVYKLAIRQVSVIAKQVQSIQVLSGSRFDFGVGISPWEEDFAVTGVPWENRGRRLDEQIDILRGLETGEFFGYEGECHSMPANKMNPVPTLATPIIIGGHSGPALSRAARLGDGWTSAGMDISTMKKHIDKINELRDEYGTADKPFAFWGGGAEGYSKEGIEEFASIGVTGLNIGFRNVYDGQPDNSLEEKIQMIDGYASECIK